MTGTPNPDTEHDTEPDPFAPPPPAAFRLAAVPAVELRGDRLAVTALTVNDPVVVNGARRALRDGVPGGLPAWTAGILAVGARAAGLAAGSGHADAIGARIDALGADLARAAAAGADEIRRAVERAADPAAGTVRVAVDQALGALCADVSALVAGEDAPLRQAIGRALEASTADAAGRVERALHANSMEVRAALGGDRGPVAVLTAEIARAADATRRDTTARIAELRELVVEDRGRRLEAVRGTAKGSVWEEMVVERVTSIAAGTGAGDTVEATGTAAGADGSRTGDAVLRLGPGRSGGPPAAVVIEAKTARWSSARWADELARARKARSAQAALGVVRGQQAMPGGGRVLVLDQSSLVVCWDPDQGDDGSLLTACVLLAATAARAAALAGTGTGADLDAVAASLRAAVETLAGFDALDRSASQARKAVDEALKVSGRLRELLAGHLGRAGRLLDAADAA